MNDDELRNLIQHKIDASTSSYGQSNVWQSERLKAEKYYKGEPRGDEKEGRSQVVSRDVAEAVDALMPSLMRVFSSGDKVVEFQPTGPEDEEQADQATDYINWIWLQQNPGFRIMHDWFKDGLLHRLGILKIWWDHAPIMTRESYRGLNHQEIEILKTDPEVEIISMEDAGEATLPGPIDPKTGQAQMIVVPLCDVAVKRKQNKGRVRIMPIPPEEFLVDNRARSLELDQFYFAAHRAERTISELIEDGYDPALLENIGSSFDLGFSQENINRFNGESSHLYDNNDLADPSLRRVLVTECYLKVDYDGDGIAELRKVTIAGNVILDNEEIDDHPFAALTPKLSQHKLIGRSIADDLYDLQDIKTTIWRQMLDNIYLANNNRTIVVNDQVNLDDLLTVRPGGIVRVKQPGAIQPFPFQNVINDAYRIIEYSDSVKENRVGVTRYNQGLDANTLNKTATGITQIMDASRQREELIARIYAEGVAIAFKKILRLVCQHQDYEQLIRLRGKFVPMDPRAWKDSYDITVAVGLGTGNKDQAIMRMMQLIDLDMKLFQLQNAAGETIVTPKNLYNKLAKIIQAAGLKAPDPYYTDPSGKLAQENKARAQAEAQAQAMAQAQQAQAQAQAQAMAQAQAAQGPTREELEAQMELQLAQVKLQADIENQRIKTQADIEAKMQMAQADIAIARMKAEAEFQRELAAAQMAPIQASGDNPQSPMKEIL